MIYNFFIYICKKRNIPIHLDCHIWKKFYILFGFLCFIFFWVYHTESKNYHFEFDCSLDLFVFHIIGQIRHIVLVQTGCRQIITIHVDLSSQMIDRRSKLVCYVRRQVGKLKSYFSLLQAGRFVASI